MAFGLQFLDGVGNAADSNVFPYTDYENKEILAQQMEEVDNDFKSYSETSEGETLVPEEFTQEVVVTTTQCNSERWMKCAAIFVGGIVAGQILKKIFKD